MTKLKLASIDDDKPVKLTVTLPAALHRNLIAYAEVLAKETGKPVEANQLIAPMLEKFIASDRGFAKSRNAAKKAKASTSLSSKPSFGFPLPSSGQG
jgi:hypothetical protein